jgi:hypothetical protein
MINTLWEKFLLTINEPLNLSLIDKKTVEYITNKFISGKLEIWDLEDSKSIGGVWFTCCEDEDDEDELNYIAFLYGKFLLSEDN